MRPSSPTLALTCLLLACQSATPEPAPDPQPPSQPAAKKPDEPTVRPPAPPTPPPAPTASANPDDPLGGKFTLEDSLKDLPGTGGLVADIQTELGKLACELYPDKAPLTVANFVGLARGLRPFKGPDGKWAKKPGYDGTTFHRVIKGFMIQGGDPMGTGAGEPGYVIADELWPGATHDKRGLLCMANRGPNTNGMQFFITDAAAPHLDRSYTIFGQCGPDELIEKLASVEVRGDRAVKPTKIEKITIRHASSKASNAKATDAKAAAAKAPKK